MSLGADSMARVTLAIALSLCMGSACAKGLKGNLEANENEWVRGIFTPILIRANICANPQGDCKDDYIKCISSETLSCNVYGVSDEKVIKEILLAVISSELNVSSFKFWKGKYHKTSLTERPLLEYTNRMEPK